MSTLTLVLYVIAAAVAGYVWWFVVTPFCALWAAANGIWFWQTPR